MSSNVPRNIDGSVTATTYNGPVGEQEYYQGTTGDDVVTLSDGDSTLVGDTGNDILSGGVGSDLLYGGDGDDVLAAGGLNYKTVSNTSQDRATDENVLWGGNGNDILVGDNGTDYFIFEDKSGQDWIYNFDATTDVIVTPSYINGNDAPSYQSVADGTLVNFGDGNTVLLIGVSSSELTVHNFQEWNIT
jgi:Ca2+-binding RTX toxin-like protein